MTPEEMDAVAQEIARGGSAHDTVTQALAKGLVDARSDMAAIANKALALLGLAKGKKKEEPDGDEDGKGGEGGKEGEGDGKGDGDGKEGEDDSPGYEDMELAVPEGLDLSDPTKALDVTKFVFETGALVRDLGKVAKAQSANITKATNEIAMVKADNARLETIIREQAATIGQMVADSNGAITSILVPLSKALVDTRESLANLPGPGVTPFHFVPRKPAAPDAAFLGGSEDREKQLLAKGERLEKIDRGHLDRFRRTRRFSDIDAENAQIRASLEAL